MILESLGSNLLLKDRKLEIPLEKPILLIKEINDSLKGNEAENSPLEPAEVPIKKGTYSVSNTVNPLVLRKLKAIRTCFMTCIDFKLYKYSINSVKPKKEKWAFNGAICRGNLVDKANAPLNVLRYPFFPLFRISMCMKNSKHYYTFFLYNIINYKGKSSDQDSSDIFMDFGVGFGIARNCS